MLARMTVTGDSKTALKLAWTKVAGADGYDIFFARRGKRFRLKKTVGASESRVVRHVRKVRFYSTDANVATIDDDGTVKAVAKGNCMIYAIANNGVRSKVKVTVK